MSRPAKGRGGPRRTPLSTPLLDAIRQRGLSATHLAAQTGLDRRGLARWLNGSTGLSLDSADQVAAAIGAKAVVSQARPGRANSRASTQAPLPLLGSESNDTPEMSTESPDPT